MGSVPFTNTVGAASDSDVERCGVDLCSSGKRGGCGPVIGRS